MNIYDILSEQTGGTYTKPEDIINEVDLALGDQFGVDESQWDEVEAKYGTYEKFRDEVLKALTDGTVQYDDSWLNGEVYMNIEGVGQDLLDGNDIGTRQNEIAEMLGTNADGTLNRVFGALI